MLESQGANLVSWASSRQKYDSVPQILLILLLFCSLLLTILLPGRNYSPRPGGPSRAKSKTRVTKERSGACSAIFNGEGTEILISVPPALSETPRPARKCTHTKHELCFTRFTRVLMSSPNQRTESLALPEHLIAAA